MYKHLLFLLFIGLSMIAMEEPRHGTTSLCKRLKLSEQDIRPLAMRMDSRTEGGPSDPYFRFMQVHPKCDAVLCCVPTALFILSIPALAAGAAAKEKLLDLMSSGHSKSD